MKRLFVSLIALLALSGTPVAAEEGGFVSHRGGFTGPGPSSTPVTVGQALDLPDDHFVVVRGTIVEQLRKEHYLFKDGTGTIEVEIDDKDWRGLTVAPGDIVEIGGEIDRGWKGTKIDVEWIRKP